MSWGKAEAYPLVESSFIKANLSGDKTVANVACTIPASALNYAKSDKLRPVVKEAEQQMVKVRTLVEAAGLNPDGSFMHVARMDVRVALFLANRQGESDKVYKNIAEISEARPHIVGLHVCLRARACEMTSGPISG